MDLPLFAKYRPDKKIGIGVTSHCNTVMEPAGERRPPLVRGPIAG
ncbi:MAG TPA: hypothetical protein VMI34_14660 [Candidatus Bathyarchaeia archaeon]|nr:hypothetical protein [Candidatus Bathyarchaeia archaeon]